MLEKIFQLSDSIRYVAVYKEGQLVSRAKSNTSGSSSSESDRYEEILVNPTLIKLATQRGDIDCGGLGFLLVRYGNFYQFVLPASWGHVSVCIETDADPIAIGSQVMSLVQA
jgi:hypothetical protein